MALREKLALLPDQPGCYLMKNKEQKVIYVGKAKNLRNRVRSYFSGAHDAKTERLIAEIADFEYIVTSSAAEALILECNLIKKHRPYYNILLKDDKSYPYIRLTKEEHPRLEVTRKVIKDGSRYFGPYPHVGAANQTKKLIDRLFPLRKCRHIPKRVCLYYHLGQCVAPCEFPVSKEEYAEMCKKIISFLNGGYPEIQKELRKQMEEAAAALQFEKAKELRDLIRDIQTVMEKQTIVFTDQMDRDVFGYVADKGWMCVQVFFVRQGKLIEREVSVFPHYHQEEEDFLSFVAQFYHENALLPKEILLPLGTDYEIIRPLVPGVHIVTPRRGLKKSLVEMATKNARLALQEQFALMEKDEEKTIQGVQGLGEALGMKMPLRIETFDNSNIQGADPVSAMVVFLNGKPAKKEYRKFKIRSVEKPDDYETMREVIRRRYTRVLKESLPLPDLILVDGGKGQIRAALDVLENELGLYIPVGGMVKDEKHRTAKLLIGDPPQEVPLEKGSQAFYLLQRIQEEVHRFAIQFHRQTRGKNMVRSVLDEIPGVGPKRKQLLYRHFGSIEKMKKAKIEEFIQAGIGEKLAQKIVEHLKS